MLCSNNCKGLASSLTAQRRSKLGQRSADRAERLAALRDCHALWQSRTAWGCGCWPQQELNPGLSAQISLPGMA